MNNTELRKFGIVITVLLAVIGTVPLVRHGEARVPFVAAAIAVALISLAAPRALAPLYKIWMKCARVVSTVNARIILSALYVAVVTPMGLIWKRLRHPSRKFGFKSEIDSYWIRKDTHNLIGTMDKPY